MNLLVKAFHAGPPSRINGVRSMLLTCANVIEKLSPEYLIFAADGGHVARTAAFADYKAHRPPKPPELLEQIALAEAAIEAIGWPLIRVTDWEADDVIASLASAIVPTSAGVVVCSCDKDLFQLCEEGKRIKIYHPWDGGKFLGGAHVEEKYGIKRNQLADYLALVGDASDGVPGVKGIGPKKAAELLGKYNDLESILEAGRCLFVPGSTGKALREHVESARMSRRLVELHRRLVIPTTWHDFPAASPRAGWVEALRSMDLGQAAHRLSELLPLTGRVRSGSSKIEVTDGQSNLWSGAVSGGSGIQAGPEAASATTVEADRSDLQRTGDVVGCRTAALPVEAGDGANGSLGLPPGKGFLTFAERSAAALADATSRDFSKPDWVAGYPVLAELPHGAPHEILCRSVYAATINCPPPERLWRSGTDFYYVADLAQRGLAFSLPAELPAVTSQTLVSSEPQTKAAYSLF